MQNKQELKHVFSIRRSIELTVIFVAIIKKNQEQPKKNNQKSDIFVLFFGQKCPTYKNEW